jgi:hypothetical protein
VASSVASPVLQTADRTSTTRVANVLSAISLLRALRLTPSSIVMGSKAISLVARSAKPRSMVSLILLTMPFCFRSAASLSRRRQDHHRDPQWHSAAQVSFRIRFKSLPAALAGRGIAPGEAATSSISTVRRQRSLYRLRSTRH